MISLKNTIRKVIIGIIVFIVLTFIINFWFVPTTKSYLNTSNQRIQNVKENIIALDLPMRVIDNVLTQVANDASNQSNIKLLEAYDKNQKLMMNATKEMQSQLELIQMDLFSVNKLSLSRHKELLNEMDDKLDELLLSASRINELIRGSKIDNTPFDIIKNYDERIVQTIGELELLNKAFNDNVVNDFTILINGILVLLILFLILFSLGVYKYVIYDQQFIIKSFEQMEQKNYDFNHLPKTRAIFTEERDIYEKIKVIYEEEQFAKDVKEIILETYHIDDVIEKLFKTVSSRLNIDRVGIAFVDYSRKKFIAEFGFANYDVIKLGPGFEVNFGKTTLTKILYSKMSFITEDLEEELVKRPNSASLKLLMEEGVQSNLVVPLIMGEAVFGMVFFSSTEKHHFNQEHLRLAEKLIYEISGMLNRAYFTKVVLSRITNSFSELVDKKDNETGDHLQRMVRYSVIIAEGLRVSKIENYDVNRKFVLEIERNASAHDIGKVGIPDEILKKPGKLDPDEWKIMKTHAAIGADIFKSLREGLQVFDAEFYRFAEDIARYHHERWDGTGYPEGLEQLEIPLAARIVAIADVFDALTSKRHYKEPFSFERSLEMIRESAGTHLDPILVDVFLKHQDKAWLVYQENV